MRPDPRIRNLASNLDISRDLARAFLALGPRHRLDVLQSAVGSTPTWRQRLSALLR